MLPLIVAYRGRKAAAPDKKSVRPYPVLGNSKVDAYRKCKIEEGYRTVVSAVEAVSRPLH